MSDFYKNDFLYRDNLAAIQERGLCTLVNRTLGNSTFYQRMYQEAGILFNEIKTLADFKKLPFTTKKQLRSAYPYGMAAVPMSEIVRIHASSGTTGKPVVMGYTSDDLNEWSRSVARICAMAGVTPSDIAQISFGYGLFTGGFGLHYGLEMLGATLVPFSSGNTERQLSLMKDFQTTVLVSTPSFALYMAEVAREEGLEPETFGLRLGLFGGEPCSDSMREEIENQWKLKTTINYGLTEVVGPGVSGECQETKGMHILEDSYYPEIINPETEEELLDGETGELVLTPINKRGFPVIRYRTGDITRIIPEQCPCGRTIRRMDYVTGRSDDMMIIKGVNLFPSQIEELLAGFRELSSHYRLILHRQKGFVKELEVQVELALEGFSDSFQKMTSLENRIKQKLRSVLSLSPRIHLMNPKSLERSAGKTKRIFEAEEVADISD